MKAHELGPIIYANADNIIKRPMPETIYQILDDYDELPSNRKAMLLIEHRLGKR